MAEPRESRGIGRRPRILDVLGSGGMPEGEAKAFADEVVRGLRGLSHHYPDEVRERREARRRSEARQHNEG